MVYVGSQFAVPVTNVYVLGYIRKRGPVTQPKVYLLALKAPPSDITVPAGGTSDLTVNMPVKFAGLAGISGLPAGVYIQNVVFAGEQLIVTFANPGANDVTIPANSLTMLVLIVEKAAGETGAPARIVFPMTWQVGI